MIGKSHKVLLVALTARRSRLTLIASTQAKKSNVVCRAFIKMLKPYRHELQTITFDNGKEFAHHQMISEQPDVSSYFANLYSSCERGLNENHSGLIRQYLPKKLSFDDVSGDRVQQIQHRLNNLPKKVFFFKTPIEVFKQLRSAA